MWKRPGVAGRVEAESGGGSMQLDDIGGGVSAETGGGSIDVGTVGGDLGCTRAAARSRFTMPMARLSLKPAAERRIQSGAQGAAIETGGGSIKVRQCTGKVKVSTGGGSVDLSDIGGAGGN